MPASGVRGILCELSANTMHDEAAMAAFARLAEVSQQKRQFTQRDKFLLLTGIAACRAGFLDVAARCREIVLAHNPQHLIRRYASLPDALRAEDFESFQTQLERFCTFEKAEYLLSEFDNGVADGAEPLGPAARVLASLQAGNWETD